MLFQALEPKKTHHLQWKILETRGRKGNSAVSPEQDIFPYPLSTPLPYSLPYCAPEYLLRLNYVFSLFTGVYSGSQAIIGFWLNSQMLSHL